MSSTVVSAAGRSLSLHGPTGADPWRTKVDSGYIDYVPKWEACAGSGEATCEMLLMST
jgi:hypothetical protein